MLTRHLQRWVRNSDAFRSLNLVDSMSQQRGPLPSLGDDKEVISLQEPDDAKYGVAFAHELEASVLFVRLVNLRTAEMGRADEFEYEFVKRVTRTALLQSSLEAVLPHQAKHFVCLLSCIDDASIIIPDKRYRFKPVYL